MTRGMIPRLVPFTGNFCTGLCFESGDCFLLYDFATTPGEPASLVEIWHISPSGERSLLVDSVAGASVVSQYHRFQRTIVTPISWTRAGDSQISIRSSSAVGQRLVDRSGVEEVLDEHPPIRLELQVRSTWRTGVLGALNRSTPTILLQTRPFLAISTAALSTLLGVRGVKTAGYTETGKAYYAEPAHLYEITVATGYMGDRNLGSLASPRTAIRFGDVIVPSKAFLAEGTLFLER